MSTSMTIAAMSIRIELTGIGPNASNNDADKDDEVWIPNEPTITMPVASSILSRVFKDFII
ncbi:Uncharacterised protein [Bifidobacterium longum subsp. infantis]|uniref:Uncharacterized protein n=1 Tax=Bifidobacterium longum subsp. infantis TaxID=1682 RepID=A0A564RXJ2_BIFLI|nr:Uncharacterised protein [Bifidobacterium longum subsp. infantis]